MGENGCPVGCDSIWNSAACEWIFFKNYPRSQMGSSIFSQFGRAKREHGALWENGSVPYLAVGTVS